MENLQTYENFFSRLFGKKDDSKSIKPKENKEKKKSSLLNFNLFSKKDDDFANKVYNSLKNTIESPKDDNNKQTSKIIGDIVRYGDYKRKVEFKSNGNTYNVSIQKSSSKIRTTSRALFSPSERYVLVINNRHFIDPKTGVSTISQNICKKIWDLLDKEQQRKWFDREKMEKDFD